MFASKARRDAALALGLTLVLLAAGCVTPPSSPPADPTGTTIEHAAGNTTLPQTPERVVVLEWTYAEDLLALGMQPVGVADVDGYEKWVKAKPALDENVADVGTRQEPDLETIASLDPDLIIGVQFRHEAIHEKLSGIAPTALFDPYPGEDGPTQFERVIDNFQTVAKAVDRQEEARATLDEMNATFEQARQQLADANATPNEIVLAQAFTQESSPTLRLFTDNALGIEIMDRIGLENAWDGGFEQFGFSTVSLEALERVEDASFLYVAQPDDDPINGTYSDDPAWRNLTFVQEDRVHPLGSDVWLFGGPLSIEYAATQTAQTLASQE